MRLGFVATAAIVAGFVLAPSFAVAQPKPGTGGQATAPARPGPYKQVPVTLPRPLGDPSLDAFRKDLGDLAHRKDRAGLATKVVSKGFFWQREDSNGAEPKKSGIDNLAAAIGL